LHKTFKTHKTRLWEARQLAASHSFHLAGGSNKREVFSEKHSTYGGDKVKTIQLISG